MLLFEINGFQVVACSPPSAGKNPVAPTESLILINEQGTFLALNGEVSPRINF